MFCGPGGLAVGASSSKIRIQGKTIGFTHSWATDYDPDACLTFELNARKHSPDVNVICSDIDSLEVEQLDPVEGLLFGFPCNDFSIVGETKGLKGSFGPLYKYGVKYLSARNPLFFVAENVSGLTSANSGKAFSQIVDELSTAGRYGYSVTKHLYKFEEYGVPQARHRVVIVGIRSDLALRFEVPKPTGKVRSSREAIECPPIARDAWNHEKTLQSPIVQERLRHIKPGKNAWNSNLPEHLRLNVSSAQLSHIYKRLDPNKPSYTVTGSGGGGTHVYHWSENRALTNRERARLQTFPDSFKFCGSKESVRKQVGMAVPPEGAKIILQAVLRTLFGVKYAQVAPSFGYS